jgi:hypothetical protein
MKVNGQLHAPAALPTGKSPWYPVDRRLPEHIGQSINLAVVLYGCGTCSHNLEEEYRSRMFENRMLGRLCMPEIRIGVRGVWLKLHNEELHNLYFSPYILRMIRKKEWMSGTCRAEKCVQEFSKRTAKSRDHLGDNIKMDLKEMRCDVDRFHLA